MKPLYDVKVCLRGETVELKVKNEAKKEIKEKLIASQKDSLQ